MCLGYAPRFWLSPPSEDSITAFSLCGRSNWKLQYKALANSGSAQTQQLISPALHSAVAASEMAKLLALSCNRLH